MKNTTPFFDSLPLRNLSPANFAFVMATAVVSLIFYKSGWSFLSWLFLAIGSIGYAVLLVLYIAKMIVLKKELFQEIKDIERMFKFLTFSAGSSSLGVTLSLSGYEIAGFIIGLVGIFSAIVLTYLLFCAFFFHIPASIQTISPFWLLLAITCNSSGMAITTLWEHGWLPSNQFLLFSFSFWTFGVFIYLIFMTLNLFRMLFVPFHGLDMDPCYWTCMGAAAIAVVDGSLLVLAHQPPLFLTAIMPFIQGMLVFLWAWGTAWIPILCLMEIWKRFYYKIPYQYQTSRWAMVFPFGMYTAALDFLSSSLHLPLLQAMVPFWLWLTFFSWILVGWTSRLNPFSK